MPAKDETIISTDDVSVRILAIAPGTLAPWHFHTEVADNMFCLTGTITVYLRDPQEVIDLAPGERVEVRPGRVHRVGNTGGEWGTYLLIQGVGRYDFNIVD